MKMMDKDDRFTYSPVLRVPFVETKAIKIYPTILSKGGLITVNIGQNKIDKVNYSIADITGKIIQTTNISINYIAVIKLKSELPSGMYFLKILNNGELLKQSTIIIQ
jgi:hypothetical protein